MSNASYGNREETPLCYRYYLPTILYLSDFFKLYHKNSLLTLSSFSRYHCSVHSSGRICEKVVRYKCFLRRCKLPSRWPDIGKNYRAVSVPIVVATPRLTHRQLLLHFFALGTRQCRVLLGNTSHRTYPLRRYRADDLDRTVTPFSSSHRRRGFFCIKKHPE
jgi:hypothetical protein